MRLFFFLCSLWISTLGLAQVQAPPPLPHTRWFCRLQLQEKKTIDFWLEQKPTRIFPPQYRIVNGREVIDLNVNTLEGDSIVCPISVFDAVLKFPLKTTASIEGRYRKNDSKTPGYYLDFKGLAVQDQKKAKPVSTQAEWAGKWRIEFVSNGVAEDTGLAVLEQIGDSLYGSILSETGDYRFLNGVASGKKAYLQTFDGAHTYRFDLERNQEFLSGTFAYSKTGSQPIRGMKAKENPLTNGFAKSVGKPGEKFSFKAKNLDAQPIDQNWEKIKGKALVVQLWGSWCPNCMDETRFLNEIYPNRPENVEFIALAFERKPDFDYARGRVEVTKTKLGVAYPMLVAGVSSKDSAAKAIPSISTVEAFPTTIFVKPDGAVLKVHTGFSGPATGSFYEACKQEFIGLIQEISKPGN